MSNTEKKYNYIDIPDLSCFDKNRVHKVEGLNVNNSYLGVGIKNGTSYVYAIKSSPNYYSLESPHKSDAYIYVKHNDNNSYQSYSFYRGYSYTYTEHLSVNNQKMALIAYQFVNRTADNTVTLYNIDTNITHTAVEGGDTTAPCHVNEKSDTSYFLRKQNESNNIEIDNNSVKIGNIKSNLGNDTYAKFNTYCAYSALDISDYYIHDDRECDMNMNAYVWNLVDGYDIKPYSYTTLTDTTKLTAYAYIDCENSLHSFFRSQSQIFDYDATHYKYIDFNYDNINVSGQQWKLGTNGTSLSYVYDNNINYAQFYANAKNCLKGHEFDSFENIVNHPSYRNNNETVNVYINIKGLSQPSGTETIDISQNNYNTAKFIKRISSLPVHMISNNFSLQVQVTHGMINAGTVEGGGTIEINKITVSSDINNHDEFIISEGTLSFSVSVTQESGQSSEEKHNYLHVTGITDNIHVHDILDTNEPHIGEYEPTGGGEYGSSYIILNFLTDNIYAMFENEFNKTIKRIDIYGSNDIEFSPDHTSIPTYIAGIKCSFGVDYKIEHNTNYTGDFHIIIKQTGGINITTFDMGVLSFGLPIS